MNKSESIINLADALAKAQSEMGGAIKGSDNPFFKSKFADLSSVIKVIKEPFAKHGLSYAQFPITADGKAGVETILMHKDGGWISSEFLVPLSKQDAQGVGSCLTYARRYALQAMAGIPSEDDDGNVASQQVAAPKAKGLSKQQVAEINEMVGDDSALVGRMLAAYKVQGISKIPASKFEEVKGRIIMSQEAIG